MLPKQKPKWLWCAIALFLSLPMLQKAHAQAGDFCATRPTLSQIQHMDATREARNNFHASSMRGTIKWVPVTWHIFRPTAGNGGLPLSVIPSLMTKLNNVFAPANIQFYMCSNPKEILDDTYFSVMTFAEGRTYGSTNDVPNTMNIYVNNSNELVGSGGYAYFPGGPERVVISVTAVQNNIFLHEVGHFFALYHTHGDDKSAEGFLEIAEFVDGSNCSFAGDDVCDTNADPYPSANTTDAHGDPYVRPTDNYMSYYSQAGQTRFTPGQYDHMAYAAVYDRPNMTCPTNSVPCSTPVTSFPVNLGFEGGTIGTWVQGTSDDFNWTPLSGATPSANTGPDVAQNGSYYGYIEATGNNPYRTAELYSPCMDLTYTQSPELTFWYHMYGTQCGVLRAQVSTDAGATWTTVWSKGGNQGNVWSQATVDLKSYVNQTFFRIRFFAATESSGDLGDIAIDNIDIHSKLCAGTTASISHTDLSCNHISTGAVTTTVSGTSGPWTYAWNTGATTASISNLPPGPYKVTITDNLGCQTTLGNFVEENIFRIHKISVSHVTDDMTYDGKIDIGITGGVPPYTFNWRDMWGAEAPGSASGITGSHYEITGLNIGDWQIEVVDAIGCKQGITDIELITWPCSAVNTINTFPYQEGFESGPGFWFAGTPCSEGWLRNTGSTPQANTGPDAAAEGDYYVYSDAATQVNNINLTGPKIDLTNTTRMTMRFKYMMNGPDCSQFTLKTYTPDIWPDPNTTLFTSPTGNQGNTWLTGAADLKVINGKNNYFLFFQASEPSPGTAGEIAIDDIEIFECGGTTVARNYTNVSCLGNDGTCGVTPSGAGAPYTYLWSNGATTASITGLAAGTYTVTVSASNGCVFVESFSISQILTIASSQTTHQAILGLNDGAINLIVNQGVSPFTYAWSNGATTEDIGNLAPGTYTVTITDARGCTTLESATVLSGSCVDFINTYPYNESFETSLGAWRNVTGDNFDWTGPFTGSTPTASTGPDVAANGTKYLYTEINGAGVNYYPNKVANLVSNCFDLSGASAATFSFKYHLYTSKASNMGSLSLQASTDNGTTWSSNLWSVSGNLTNTWLTANVSLNAYVGKSVRLRFQGISGTGGDKGDRALDQFSITITAIREADEAPGIELGPKALENVALYPNPTTGQFNISFDSFDEQSVEVRLIDLSGKVLSQNTVNVHTGTNKIEMNAATQVSGMYFVEIVSGESRVIKRLIISE